MIVDTHAHLYLDRFDADRDAVVERARQAGVTRILQPPTDAASLDAALAVCDRYDGVYAMAGIHPTSVAEAQDRDLDRIREALADARVVAVGETGLDYYWSRDAADRQQECLREHVRMAIDHDLPIVLHNRDVAGSEACSRDLVRILREEKAAHPDGSRLRGVFHCFGGPVWLTGAVLDLGFHIGLGGTLTYKKGGVPEAVASVPLARIVLETDAPYLAPSPHRGQRNEPAFTRLVADRLAALRALPVEAIEAATTQAAERLFGLG